MMEKWHILCIGLLCSTYLLAWQIQMNDIQNGAKPRKIGTEESEILVEGKLIILTFFKFLAFVTFGTFRSTFSLSLVIKFLVKLA